MAPDNTVLMEGVTLAFRNFAGKEGKYNREGDRNFAVFLDDAAGQALLEDGWNVKTLNLRDDAEEGETPQMYLPVAVGYKGKPPKITMITSGGRTMLGEDEVEILDWADIQNVDLIVRPYAYDVNGRTGIKAYLKTMFITIEEDDLELKYNAKSGDEEMFPE